MRTHRRTPWCAALVLALGAPLASAGEYRVGAGDALDIQVYDEPELSGEVRVTEGCTVSLGLIGRVAVCERTVGEIEQALTARYAGDFLVEPSIAVKVAEYRSQRVDVLGEVEDRGPIYLEGPTTLVEAISMAGGPNADNVVVVEVTSVDGTTVTHKLPKLLAAAEPILARPGDKISLQPGEVVYVEGEIRNPGTVVLSDGLTVTQALALAGGPAEYANLRRVLVRRADGDKVRVNVQRVHKGVESDVILAADDQLIVPRGAF